MSRTLTSLLVAVALLVGSTHTYARGVHFGLAGQSGFVHPGSGFLDRHVIFKSLAAPGVVFVPCGDPYAIYPLDPWSVALP